MDDLITEVMRREGWDKYTNRPNDRGGPTKWGITLKAWQDYVGHTCTENDIKAINEGQARDFYSEEYVVGPGFDKIKNRYVRELVVDCGVNHGPRRAAKWVQHSVFVKQDGILGPISLEAVNQHDPLEVYLETLAYRIKLYGRLVTKDPRQAEFAAGWNNRAASFLEAAGQRIATGLEAV